MFRPLGAWEEPLGSSGTAGDAVHGADSHKCCRWLSDADCNRLSIIRWLARCQAAARQRGGDDSGYDRLCKRPLRWRFAPLSSPRAALRLTGTWPQKMRGPLPREAACARGSPHSGAPFSCSCSWRRCWRRSSTCEHREGPGGLETWATAQRSRISGSDKRGCS